MTVMPPPGSSAGDEATETFACHRELLFWVVYSMLGTVADSEDVLQETWQSWASRSPEPGEGAADPPRACLVRSAARRALARQDAVRRRRESYIGSWLPEPLVSPLDAAGRAEPVSMGMLVVLEDLTALERAVFVLSEVAGCPPAEIAEIVGRSPATVRRLARQGVTRVEARRPRPPADPRIRQATTARFAAAMLGADPAAFGPLLAPEVTIRTDSGGKAGTAGLSGVHHRDKAAVLLAAGGYRPSADPGVRCRRVNGDLSLVVTEAGAPFAVLVLDLDPDGGRVRGIYAVTNPDKLSRAGLTGIPHTLSSLTYGSRARPGLAQLRSEGGGMIAALALVAVLQEHTAGSPIVNQSESAAILHENAVSDQQRLNHFEEAITGRVINLGDSAELRALLEHAETADGGP